MSGDLMQIWDVSPRYRTEGSAQDVSPRHKQTEVGIIPEEWRVSTVDGIASSKRNAIVGGPFGSDLVSTDYVGHGVPVIRGQNMGGKWLSGPFAFVTSEKARSLSANLARPGDLVFTQRGTLGQVSLVPNRPFEAYLVSQSQMKVTLDREVADPLFVFYVFHGATHQRFIREGTIQTGVPHINLGILRAVPIPLPCINEQDAIAEALSDVDSLLGSLDALIAKKRGIKQAAVQQLLAGKTRLPGFSEEWEVKRLGEVGGFLKGSGVKKDESQSGELPCIRYGEIYTHHHDHIRSFKSWISPKVADTATPLRRGDVLFAGSGETKEEIGKCVAFDHDVEAYAGSDIVILRPNGVNSLFLGYLLNTHAVVSQKASRGQGDAVVHISSSALADICVSLPSLEEQAAIAGVISDVDAEIAALEVRRDKTRALKQGMMQQLLTGRIRLVEPAAREEQA